MSETCWLLIKKNKENSVFFGSVTLRKIEYLSGEFFPIILEQET